MKKLLFSVLAYFAINSYQALAQTQFWGTTQTGGQYGAGTIFKTDGSGNNQTLTLSFFVENEGANPSFSHLISASDGKFYGMTYRGGVNNMGVLFQYDPTTNIYTKKLDFNGVANGAYPQASLMQASDGKLYGTTNEGGVNNMGVLFQYDPTTNIYTKKFDFDGVANGQNPYGSLMQASDGKLYGMTYGGGANGMGVLFQYDPTTNIYTKKLDFNGTANGQNPYGSLMQASDGKLYGMTNQGGVNYNGVLFQYDPITNAYTKKLDFDGGVVKGGYPQGSLMQASDGKLYGTTSLGGVNDAGVLFQYDPATNTYAKKLDFNGTAFGGHPQGSLMQANDGKLYGMTSLGGVNYNGILFQFDPATNICTKKLDFNGTANGAYPQASLMQASDGKLYGMTNGGGVNDVGVLFQYDPTTNTYAKKFDFDVTANGEYPKSSLMQANDGKLYGMTYGGGVNDMGVLFQYDPITNSYTKKLDFNGVANGAHPQTSLIQASDGKLYGTTNEGGVYDMGVLFQYDPTTNIYTKKFDFDGAANGRYPQGSLMQASDGKLYGTTNKGGVNDMGVLFQYDPATNIYIKKLEFYGGTSGTYPYGSLMQASDGKLYGTTNEGGVNNMGLLFQYDPATNTYTMKFDFDGVNGVNPNGSLIQASDGKLYGTTNDGGGLINSSGVLFQYDPATNICTKKLVFDGTNGADPQGSLMQASDGKLYGMTSLGGVNDMGVLFQYDPVTNTYTKKLDFDGVLNGEYPWGDLIEISITTTGINNWVIQNDDMIRIYPNPNNGIFTLQINSASTISVVNVLGQIVIENTYEAGAHQLNIQNQAKGLYFVKINTNEGTQSTTKIVVE